MSNGIPNNKNKEKVQASSGNVFADLGLADAEGLQVKAQLVQRICRILAAQKLTQAQAAALLDIDQPKISALLHGKLSGFSTERLLAFLTMLNHDVQIVVRRRPARSSAPRIVVS